MRCSRRIGGADIRKLGSIEESSPERRRRARADGPAARLSNRAAEPLELLVAKTTVPTVRPGTVMRPGLVNRLRAARAQQVVTLVAPAGYGKTTLLSQWAERDERPFAWVTLDEGDDGKAVLRYVAAALVQSDALGKTGHEAGGSPSSSVPRLAAALARVPRPIVLVLDDVHVVRSQPAAALIATLVKHVPAGSALVLAGRALPELPVARLRAEGALFELGASELALSRREVQLLLRGVRPELDEADSAELAARTEGWAAGVHLAGLVVQDGGGGRRPVAEFTGEDRFVAEYFRLEHLSQLDPADLRFLTRSSVLESMCGPLCDAVVDDARDSALTLEALEEASLFVVPLDRHRVWYRYHRLFREALRAELERREPELASVLNRRAAAWYEANGSPDVARRYAAAAGDINSVARIVATRAMPAFADGCVVDLDSWLDSLGDPAILERHPAAAVVGGWIHALGGRAGQAELWLDAAEHAAAGAERRDGTSSMRPLVALLRAGLCRQGVERMLADAESAAAELAWADRWRPTALLLCGVAHLLRGEDHRADARLAAADELAAAFGATDIRRLALVERSLLATAAGERARGRELAQTARSLSGGGVRGSSATSALELAALASAELSAGGWQEARKALDDAESLASTLTHALPWCSVQALLELARAHLALLDVSGATVLLTRAEQILELRPDLGVLASRSADIRSELVELREQDGRRESMLTPAELRLLPHLATRLSFREIGEHLHVSRNTVKTQAISVYRKLGVSSRNDAIDRAIELGLLQGPPTG